MPSTVPGTREKNCMRKYVGPVPTALSLSRIILGNIFICTQVSYLSSQQNGSSTRDGTTLASFTVLPRGLNRTWHTVGTPNLFNKQANREQFLGLGTTDMWGWIYSSFQGCEGFSSPLVSSCEMPVLPLTLRPPQCDSRPCLWTLPRVAGGTKPLL